MWFVEEGAPSDERYAQARSRIGELIADTASFMGTYHAMLGPTTPMTAFPHGKLDHPINGLVVPKFHVTKNTSPWDYTGSPALSVPFGWNGDGMPIGVQLVGRHFDEPTVLRLGVALETGAPDRHRRPPL